MPTTRLREMRRCSWVIVLLLWSLACCDSDVLPQSPDETTDGLTRPTSLATPDCDEESEWEVPPPQCRRSIDIDELLQVLNGNLKATFTSLADSISQLSDAMVWQLLTEWTGRQQSASELAQQIRHWGQVLATEVLIAENVEESDGCLVTLRVPTDWLCETLAPTPYESEQDCLFWHLPIRLELWPISEELVALGILVGDPRIESLVAIVSLSGLSITVDLPKFLDTMREVNAFAGLGDLPELLGGTVAARLTHHPENIHVEVHVLETVAIEWTIQSRFESRLDAIPLHGRMDPVCPFLSLDSDGWDATLSLNGNITSNEVGVPLEVLDTDDLDVCEAHPETLGCCSDTHGQPFLCDPFLDRVVGRTSPGGFEVWLTETEGSLLIRRFAPTPLHLWVERTDEVVFDLETNPDTTTSSAFAVDLETGEGIALGLPEQSIALRVHGQSFIEQGWGLPEWLRADMLHLTIGGSDATLRWYRELGDDWMVAVDQGNVGLSSQSTGAEHTANAGDCFVFVEDEDQPNGHPLARLAVRSCANTP